METRSKKRRLPSQRHASQLHKRTCRENHRTSGEDCPRKGLEDLPAEVLEQILLESAELSLIHVSSRLHAILPSYQRWAKGLLLLCFLQQERSWAVPNWYGRAKAKRWSVPGIEVPLSDDRRLLLQRKVINSHWLALLDLVAVLHDLLHINVCEVIDGYDLSIANSVKINHLFKDLTSVTGGSTFSMHAIPRDDDVEYKISIPNGFVVQEICDNDMTIDMRATFDVLHIPDKLLTPPFTRENILTFRFLRQAWDPSSQMGAKLDFNRDLLRPSILALIDQEKPVEKASGCNADIAEIFITLETQLLMMLLELEVTGLANGYKQCVKDEYFEAAIFGAKFSCLSALMHMDPCWPRKIKIRNMVKNNIAEKPTQRLPEEVARFVNRRREDMMRDRLENWPPCKGHCGTVRRHLVRVLYDLDKQEANFDDDDDWD
jgi:hypothetical protein